MHILYIHQYFQFPDRAGGTRSYDLARSFVDQGHNVTVLSSNVSGINVHNSGKWQYLERDGIAVFSVDCPYNNGMSFYQRINSFLLFLIRASIKVLKIKADVVLVTSTPLTVAVPALVKKIFNKTPFVFEVRDVWPEVPIQMGIINNKLLINFLRWFEKLIYHKATAIVPLSVGMCKNITSRISGLEDKMMVIPNIAELDRFADYSSIIQYPFELEGKKILLYCGTLGKVNGLSYLVELASQTLNKDPNIIYCVVGTGKELDSVLSYAQEKEVLNVNFYYMGVVKKNELPYLYKIASVGSSFVINNSVLWDNSANKFFDTLAAHRPIVINHEGWQADEIRNNKCGYVLPPVLDEQSVNDFIVFMNDNELLSKYGKNAYELAKQKYSLPIAVSSYIKVFQKVK